jgi:ubiquitin C-terminal hydrolase
LKQKLITLDKSNYSEKDTEKNFRFWKLNTQASLEAFKKVFSEKANDVRESETEFKCSDLLYLEYNGDCQLEDLELADTDLTIVEYSTENSGWIFEVKKMEQKEGKCEWCNNRKMLRFYCACKEVWYCREDCLDKDKNFHSSRCKKRFEVEENSIVETPRSKKGLVGLQNLGNTCFMNTSLQCVSNCYELTQYFLKDLYKKDINQDNPIGTGGVLAKAYANFLKNVWYGEAGVFSPWNFKRAIATFQSMFSGYQQHDTQEFLNYLLDGLHEDLNRVLKKPLVEKDDSNKHDNVKSQEQWIGYLRRNQSVLVDLLYGQYKSTLYCPDQDCQNVSTTFDPFLSISLPLVAKTETYETICYFIFYDIKLKPLQLTLPFSVDTTIMALRNKVGKMLNIHPFSFFVIKMDRNGNYDHLVNSSALIKTNNYFASDNQRPFFLFQIDPELFYSNYNKYCLNNESLISMKRDFKDITEEMENREEENKKLFSEDYEEDESGVTSDGLCYYSKFEFAAASGRRTIATVRVNTDDNYGFSDDYLKTVLFLKKYEEDSVEKKARIIFPRIVYLNKKNTTKQVHYYIFKYFSPLIRKHHKFDENEWPEDKLWEKFFDTLDTDNKNDSYEYQAKNNWPYRIRIKNINESRYGHCYFCENQSCNDCLLPLDDKITIADLVAKIPKNEGAEIDNNYLFLNRTKLNYYSNKDFQLEVTWLPEYNETVHNLNDKRDYDFKIIRTAKPKSVSIYDCFKNFVKLEKLEENNEWYCPVCKKHQKATKKMEIYKSPHILIVHLKRFKNNSKIDTVVDFPINGLDISNYVIEKENNLPQVYDLFAIANHYGGMGFGHYISYAKNPFDNKWYEFDDSHVSSKSEEDLVGSSAYVLFYRRRGLENYINPEEIYNKAFVNYENTIGTNDKVTDTSSMNNTQIEEKNNNINNTDINSQMSDGFDNNTYSLNGLNTNILTPAQAALNGISLAPPGNEHLDQQMTNDEDPACNIKNTPL